MSLLLCRRTGFAATHTHSGPPNQAGTGRHGHNFQLSLSARSELAPDETTSAERTLAARLAELRGQASGNPSVEALWAAAQAGWPAGVRAEAVTLVEASGAGATVEAGQPLFISPGYFSAAHRTHAPRLSDAENRALYGICDNPAGHGHNYRVTVWHPTLAQAPAAVWAEFDHRNLSVDIPALQGRNVVTEAIAELIARRVPGAARVRVWETDTFYAEFTPATGAYQLGRRFHFSAAHALPAPADCGPEGAHGHDFTLTVVVGAAQLDEATETAFDLGAVDQAAAEPLQALHEHDLDVNVPWLAGQMTTPAVLAAQLWNRLEPRLGAALNAVGVAATTDQEAWNIRG